MLEEEAAKEESEEDTKPALPSIEDGMVKQEVETKSEEDEKPKLESEADGKLDIKGEVKSEGSVSDIKNEADVKMKEEDVKAGITGPLASVKVEDGKKRTSIFLLSDDEDDEL